MTSRAASLLLVLLAAPLLADPIQYSFTTTGAFGAAHPDLTFANQSSAVTGTTVSGAASNLALGSFTLTRPPGGTTDTYNDVPFTLDVLFSLPPDISGGNQGQFDAELSGTITRGAGDGELSIAFVPVYRPFTFDNGVIQGSFTFGITNGGIANMDWANHDGGAASTVPNTSATYDLTAYISGASQSNDTPTPAVPEPGSIGLLATVLAGVVFSFRRKSSV